MRRNMYLIMIDICGSKEFIDKSEGNPSEARRALYDQLYECAKNYFPGMDSEYPKGSFYGGAGDCNYIILDNANVSIRSTIEFMKGWTSKLNYFPDCRAIIGYGEITETTKGSRLELTGEVFENISCAEKLFREGEIGVTDELVSHADRSLVQYINKRDVKVTDKRYVSIWSVNYENPRLLKDSSIAHALFIADHKAKDIRYNTFKAIILETLAESVVNSLPIVTIIDLIRDKNIPEIPVEVIKDICQDSEYLMVVGDEVAIRPENLKKLESLRELFIKSKESTIECLVSNICSDLKVQKEVLLSSVDLAVLTEEFLCAVLLEIRMMAAYSTATSKVFERLARAKEYDYILKKHFKKITNENIEIFVVLKRSFLSALRGSVGDDNLYIASIFHNVLMLYYLNQNPKVNRAQLTELRKKKIYIDTNTFYAHRCLASAFNGVVKFFINKLVELKVPVIMFDRSVKEYNESLDYAFAKYNRFPENPIQGNYYSWIWTEFDSNRRAYHNKFEFCVTLHKIPSLEPFTIKEVTLPDFAKALEKYNVTIEELAPFKDKDELGELFLNLYREKSSNKFIAEGNGDSSFDIRVLHDANCIEYLKHHCDDPFSAEKLFVTCDFSLARFRSRHTGEFEYVITAPEFFEFMLPYLFISGEVYDRPSQIPNMLIAASISKEFFETKNLDDFFCDSLTDRDFDSTQYEILAKLSNRDRFKYIKKQYDAHRFAEREKDPESYDEFLKSMSEFKIEYEHSVKEHAIERLVVPVFETTKKELEKVTKENLELTKELEFYREKDKKRKRYYKMLKNRQKRS